MKIENVAVIGAGTMGHALALVHAIGNCNVRLNDISEDSLDKARGLIEAACATLLEADAIDNAAAKAAIDRIQFTTSLADAVGAADLVVEAVVEKPDIKREVFRAIDDSAPPPAIVASNTSYLDIFPLVPETRQPRVIIAHWYTPPYIVDLVDIAPGPETEPEVVEAMRKLYKDFGKEPLVFKRLIPGYIANRLQSALNLECFRMIDEGWVSAQDIDFSIHHGLALRLAVLGHMRKADYTGLQMVQNALASRMYEPPEHKGGSETLSRLLAEGRTGVQSGAGFYDYAGAAPEDLFKDRDLKLLQLKAHLRKITKGKSNDQG